MKRFNDEEKEELQNEAREAGERAAMQLCPACSAKMREVIKTRDLFKGANHLLKLYRENACNDCLNMIHGEGLKYARGVK